MPTVAFVSPKGGAGKTTSAFLLATALTRFQDVTVIDADPNHPIENWARGGNAPAGLTIVSDVDEDTIIERIEEAAPATVTAWDGGVLAPCTYENERSAGERVSGEDGSTVESLISNNTASPSPPYVG